jgi:hypothetical protein
MPDPHPEENLEKIRIGLRPIRRKLRKIFEMPELNLGKYPDINCPKYRGLI